MSVRTDIVVLPDLSPRLILVQAPSTEVVLQDLHDTLRAWEDSPAGAGYDLPIISSAGKENLGGGVTVGLTSTLQNAQLLFEARTTPIETGTVSSATSPLPTTDYTTIQLIDAGQNFLTTVEVGDLAFNVTDNSWATIIEIVSDTELTCFELQGGTDNDFDMSDAYEIYRIYDCNISGGNLVAVDDLLATLDATVPTFGTQIVRTSSSSATVQNLEALEYSSFSQAVWIDVINGTTGTDFPKGTPGEPVNNLPDALFIAEERGFKEFRILGNITLDVTDFSDGYIFHGQSPGLSTITINPGANVTNCDFLQATVTGTLDGGNTVRNCNILTLNYVNGFLFQSALSGTVTLGGGAQATILACYSGVAGGLPSETAKIDFGGSGQSLVVRNYSGGIEFKNKSGTDAVSVDMLSGQVVIDSTVTAGVIYIRGSAYVTNNAAAARIDCEGMTHKMAANQTWEELGTDHTTTGTFGAFVQKIQSIVKALLGLS